MIDTRPIEPVVAAALASAAYGPTANFENLQSLVSIFGTPLAKAASGEPHGAFDAMILLSDGHQHGILAFAVNQEPVGRIYWGAAEEILDHFFGPDSRIYWWNPERAEKSMSGILADFPVVSA